ncbi:zinc/manganese transport system substrate-binding protein [Curtobacterium luteum]|uniref:ABC transporter substrate-binding protein n=1 Tax=Curtobacterium luteum TaxID=33881 RepID=A0A8H9L0M8_9MICO|nr:zinc/manganese transport system substrate-binding protein [Curtobacterium luteum]GGK99577.1 ABC transporter substrate-binding protein [Curtobacterium luteum]
MTRVARAGTAAVRTAVAVLAAGLVVTSAGCSPADRDRPLVAVTTNILGDVVSEVVGDAADVAVLMPAGADPHSFEVSAREAARLRSADLVVENGLGLEEGVARHVEAATADGVPVFTAGDAIDVLDWRTEDDSGPDPHFWTDPRRMAEVVSALDDALDEVGIDAPGADGYRAQLDALDGEVATAFATVPADRRALVTNHHVFGYLADRYGFRIVGAVIPSGTTLASPSAADLRDLATVIEDAGVPTIFADLSQPARLAEVLADEAGIQVTITPLATESLTATGPASSYLGMTSSNAEAIVDGLSTHE